MAKFPKLKIKRPFGYPSEEIRDFEQAQYFLFSYAATATPVAEGEVVSSYEELVKLANRDCYRDREFLEVMLLPTDLIGG